VLVIVAVTGTVVIELSEAVSVMVPEKGPGWPAGNWPGLTVTEIPPIGRFPVIPAVNHGEPSFVDVLVVKLVTLELLLVIVTGRDDGTVLPGAKENINELGFAVSVPTVPETLRLTST